MQFELSRDFALVREIVTHPAIYEHSGDDFAPPRESWQPSRSAAIWYVLVRDGDDLLGLFAFNPLNAVCFNTHICLLPNAWGERAREAGREVVRWMWEHSPAVRLIGIVPEYNRLALRLARACGFEQFGVNRRSHLKDGELHDEIFLGVSKWV